MTASLNIVVAMKAEARPLIDRFELTLSSPKHGRFPIYENGHIVLIVSGIGSANAQEAVQCLACHCARKGVSAWLNIGVAGHGSINVGQGFLADCISLIAIPDKRFTPYLSMILDWREEKITTVSEVEN